MPEETPADKPTNPAPPGFLKRRAVCEACGYDLGAVETGDGAATFIMQIAGFLVGFSALAVEIAWRPLAMQLTFKRLPDKF